MKPGFSNKNIVMEIASAMGEVRALYPPDCIVQKGKVQKALVLLDVRNPLCRGFWMKNAAGEDVWIRLYYEKATFQSVWVLLYNLSQRTRM